MNDYQREQLDAFIMVAEGLPRLGDDRLRRLRAETAGYLSFRESLDRFLTRHFQAVCTATCYRSRTSACCSKDGIITFFADTVVNALNAAPEQLAAVEQSLRRPHTGHRCVYLGQDGCQWAVRPLVCAMFLCDRAMATVFDAQPAARTEWDRLRQQERSFRWPDRPVLFDELEKVFLDLGCRSSLMHLNTSPGLLRVKRRAGLI